MMRWVFFLYFFTIGISYGQVNVRLHKPPPNELKIIDLWYVDLENTTDKKFEIYLRGEVKEAIKGLVFRGNAILVPDYDILLPFEKERIKVQQVSDVKDAYYLKEYEDYIKMTGEVPDGKYIICVYVIDRINGNELGRDCVEHSVKKIGKVRLISPKNRDTIKDEFPLFVWNPPTGLRGGLDISYRLRIVEILDGQTKEEAMRANPAWFEEKDIKMSSFRYPAYGRKFENGKSYAWMVIAKISGIDQESEVWSFTFSTPSPKAPPPPSPLSTPACGSQISHTIQGSNLWITGTSSSDAMILKKLNNKLFILSYPSQNLIDSVSLSGIGEIKVKLCEGNDIIAIDENLSNYKLHVEGNEDNDIIIGAVNLSILDNVLSALDSVNSKSKKVIDSAYNLVVLNSNGVINDVSQCSQNLKDSVILPFNKYVISFDSNLIRPFIDTVKTIIDKVSETVKELYANKAYEMAMTADSIKNDIDSVRAEIDSLKFLIDSFFVDVKNLINISVSFGCSDKGFCAKQPSNMIAWYPLDEKNPPIAKDIKNNHNGTWKNSIISQSGIVNNAYRFNEGYVEVPDHPDFSFTTGELTIDAWIKADSQYIPNEYAEEIVWKRGHESSNPKIPGFSFQLVGSPNNYGQLDFVARRNDGQMVVVLTGGPNLKDGKWHHVAVTLKSGDKAILYVDGIQVASAPALTFNTLDNDIPLRIGMPSPGWFPQTSFRGIIDEVEIYNRALRPDEIKQIYFAGKFGKCLSKETFGGKKTIEEYKKCVNQFLEVIQNWTYIMSNTFCNDTLPDPPENNDPFCQALEEISDSLENYVNSMGDNYENNITNQAGLVESKGDTIKNKADMLGDDENPNSFASYLMNKDSLLSSKGDALNNLADSLNNDWENFASQIDNNFSARGDSLYSKGSNFQSNIQNYFNSCQSNINNSLNSVLNIKIDSFVNSIISSYSQIFSEGMLKCVGSFNSFYGGPGLDIILGTMKRDSIFGEDGIDLLIGRACPDVIDGGDSTDIIFGGGGDDKIYGKGGIDVLIGNDGNDEIYGGGGDTLGKNNNYIVFGDIFIGNGGNDKLISGNSKIDDENEVDVAFGDDGNDEIYLSHGGNLKINNFEFKFGNVVFGGKGNDKIETKDGIDLIFGDEGNDSIMAGKGDTLKFNSSFEINFGNFIFCGKGNDHSETDGDFIDLVFGGEGNDVINVKNGGNLKIDNFNIKIGNIVFGGEGNDKISSDEGIDFIFGQNGDDKITSGKGSKLEIDNFSLDIGDFIFAGNGNDTITTNGDFIDLVFGEGGNDVINVNNGGFLKIDTDSFRLGNFVFGGSGNDSIVAQKGIDLIFGEKGYDYISAGEGYNFVFGDFSINVGDFLFGQEGNDIIHGDNPNPSSVEDGIDLIFGGEGNDKIYGGGGGTLNYKGNFCLIFGNLLFGSEHDDTIRGDYLNWNVNNPSAGIDLIFGGKGNDVIEGSGGSLLMIGSDYLNSIYIWLGNILFGSQGNDRIFGADKAAMCNNFPSGMPDTVKNLLNNSIISQFGGGADFIFAGKGNDYVNSYDGIDFVFGSEGDDSLFVNNGGIFIIPISGAPVPFTLGNLTFGGDGGDYIESKGKIFVPQIEPIIPFFQIDLLFGNKCNDVIRAGRGFNIVFGNRDNDSIFGGSGINFIFGDRGDDYIQIQDSVLSIPNLTLGIHLVFGGRGKDIIKASNTNNMGLYLMFGSQERDIIEGGDGINLLFGSDDDDKISAGVGLSLAFGSKGSDEIITGDGLSLAFGGKQNDKMTGGNGLSIFFGSEGDDIISLSSGLQVAFGGEGNDLMRTGNGLNVLFGSEGNDHLVAGSGLSVLFGGKDNDVLKGGSGLFIGFGSDGDDLIEGGSDLNIVFAGDNNDEYKGGSGMDIVFGGAENDKITGEDGMDILLGGSGSDDIKGGGGSDFIFGNKDNDNLESGNSNYDFVFGNKDNDNVYSGNDNDKPDFLFGNGGNDNLRGCPWNKNPFSLNKDLLFGGFGSDNKGQDCSALNINLTDAGKIVGRVMEDIDWDGDGDVGVSGINISLGTSQASTNSEGYYIFTGLNGSYNVSILLPSGYVPVSSQNVNVSQHDFQVVDFIIKKKPQLCGYKFNDLNGNGIKDSGEPGIPNWTIILTDLSGAQIVTTTTDQYGRYCFDIQPGKYIVKEVTQSGYTPTTNTEDTILLKPNGEIIEIINGEVSKCPSPISEVNFGNKKGGEGGGGGGGSGKLCIYKFNDLDGDGIKDTNEPFISWHIRVYKDTQLVWQGNISENGKCMELQAGTYTIIEQGLSGWIPTTPTQQTISIQAGQTTNVYFGNKRLR